MSTVVLLFLFDPQAFDGLVRPAIAEFLPGNRSGAIEELLRRALDGGGAGTDPKDPAAGYDRVLAELAADAKGRPRDPDHASLYEVFSGRAHPGLEDARASARFLLDELRESPLSPSTRAHLAWIATRTLVELYCVPWSRVRDPMFQMSGSAGESFLAEHGQTASELLLEGKIVNLAKHWDVKVLSAAESAAWAKRLRSWGRPAGEHQRADYDRLLALFDVGSKGQSLRLAVTSE